jgi:DNA (cytosine-5)-methyltransferase 1
LKFISLFSGAGGLDLGFEQEGFEPVIAYDKKSSAVCTYNHNRNRNIAKVADLGTMSGQDIICDLESTGITEKPCGVVGGPPCQYFSNGNKAARESDDPRRTLPIKYAEILRELNIKYELDFFILENVDGLAQPRHKEDFSKILEMFDKAGFYVANTVLNAYDYGVPQIRRRLFLIGWNKNKYHKGSYSFPSGFPCGISVIDKIGGLPEPVFYKRNLDPSTFPVHPNHWTMRPLSKKFGKPLPSDMKRYTRSFRRLDWNKPSDTVAYGHNEIHIHPSGHRRLSIYEAMLLQGFPQSADDFTLIGCLSDQVSLISDAVPPPLAAALAHSIKEHIIEYKDA